MARFGYSLSTCCYFQNVPGGLGMPQDLSLLGPLLTVYYAMLIVLNYMTTTGSSRFDSSWTNVFFPKYFFLIFIGSHDSDSQ